ncbi:MAG TPA: hypothetical protein VFM23_01370 [Gemmatimonadales bacterium]|nr:hypothetical protein [Gemmatimonadales bacterium]
MSLEFGAERLGVFQSAMQGGNFFTGAGKLRLECAEALRFAGFAGGRFGEPDAGLIGFGTRFIEGAAELFQPTLQQQGSVRAP